MERLRPDRLAFISTVASFDRLFPLRFLPNRPLPPYSYVPGETPHPISDPRGHSHGESPEDSVGEFAAESWSASPEYLWAVDLYNHGFYWEAHEAWEQLWIAAGRKGMVADFLKGLIKLAAAGVKLREGNPRGVARHSARSAELFRLTRERLNRTQTARGDAYAGVQLDRVVATAERLASRGGDLPEVSDVSRSLPLLPMVQDRGL